MSIKLTIFFDDQFWIGIFERIDNGLLETSRIVFGSEPKDYEVYEYVLKNYYFLKFSRPYKIEHKANKKVNPKKLQHLIKKEVGVKGIGTKSQQAMKLEHEALRVERKKVSKEQKEEMERLLFEKRQEKKKEKKKGH